MTWFNSQAPENDPSSAFGGAAMPIGKYPVVITGSRVEGVQGNERSGKLLFELLIIDGPNKDHKGNWILNLFNENEQARQIAARQLSAVCHVVNTHQLILKPEGVELWGKPFVIEFRKQAKDERYVECAGVFDMSGNPPGKSGGAAPQQTAQPQQFAGQQAPQGTWGGGGAAPAQQQPAATAWGGGGQPAQQPAQNGAAPWGQQPQQQPAQAQPQTQSAPWQQAPAGGGQQAPWQR